MYLVYKWLQYFFLALSEMFASCAEIGMIATLKAEYVHIDQKTADQINGSVQDQCPAEDP